MAGKINYRFYPVLIIVTLFCSGFFFSGCINLKLVPPDDPGWGTGFFLITNEIMNFETSDGEMLKESEVSVSDNQIYAVLKIFSVEKKAGIRWHWYGPEGKLKKRSERWEVNPDGNYLDYFLIWDSLENHYFREKKGKWTVTVFVDGKYHISRTFHIR